MNSVDRSLKQLIDRHVPSPSQLELAASRERILDQLSSQPAHDQKARVADRGTAVFRWRLSHAMAAAAGVVLAAVIGSVILTPGENPRYRVVDGTVKGKDVIQTGATGAMLRLSDRSWVEMRSNSELSVVGVPDGMGIRLRSGGIIVNAAKQEAGHHLYVYTKDMTVSVVGTIFLVDADATDGGSRVGVIEGEVRVQEGTVETRLRPGERVSAGPKPDARSLRQDLAWSRQSQAYNVILDAFTKGMNDTAARLRPPAGTGAAFTQAQSSAKSNTDFEEATIRECDPDNLPRTPEGGRGGGANSLQMTPGRLNVLCMTTATLIRTAYALPPAGNDFLNDGRAAQRRLNLIYGLGTENGIMVRGGPDWVRTARYTIEAITDPAANAETMSTTRLRSLLERRFQLMAHVEVEQIPAFTLTVAKGGLKMKPTEPGGCEEVPIAPQGQKSLRGRSAADVRRGAKHSCGIWTERDGPNLVTVGGGATISGEGLGNNIARGLGLRLGGLRVFDNTGLTDRYNFILEHVLDENTPGIDRIPVPANDTTGIPRAPNIFTALEEQLGLKLEPTRTPRNYIVIDRVERPSAN